MDYTEFRKKTLNINNKRKRLSKKSYTTRDLYYKVKKNLKFNLEERTFNKIIRTLNNYIIMQLFEGNDVHLPYAIGRIELVKYYLTPKADGSNLPIDWEATMKLWYENEECAKKKQLVRYNNRVFYKVRCHRVSIFKNRVHFKFRLNDSVRNKLIAKIKEGEIDALVEDFNNNKNEYKIHKYKTDTR